MVFAVTLPWSIRASHPWAASRFSDRFELENSSLGLGLERRVSMRTSRFTEAQIAFVLRQADEGTAIGEVCQPQTLRVSAGTAS